MYIKNIFYVKNYKGLEDGFNINFNDITYIVGDNAKNKTTIGSLPVWILTGYNLYGNNREVVSNDKENRGANTIASMTIIDNTGCEHIITRSKGKDNCVMLDGIRTTQEIISGFYKDIHTFLCAYNPSYFRSMKLADQRELLLRVLPAISSDYAFNLLEKEEQEILETPVVDIKGFNKAKRAEIKQMKSDLDKMIGNKNALIDIAIQKEDSPLVFDKTKELQNLEQEYERLIENTDNIITLEDLENDINKLDERIKSNIKIELKDLQEKQKKELENFNNVSSMTSNCPVCKQPIQNENLVKMLKIKYKNNVNELADRIEKLKEETKEFINKKESQLKKYEFMKTPEMQEQIKRKDELKNKIDILQEEKRKVDLANKEIEIKHNDIIKAKAKIEQLDKEIEIEENTIKKYEKQIKIAGRLHLLIIKEQMKEVSEYLDKVTIEFNKVDEETGEISDVYEIKYDGREYEKLSKSYKLRADIEIATLLNKVLGIKTPMFVDDVESITGLKLPKDTQIIMAIVIKFNELEILNSYSDVLEREKRSIDKKIQENSNQLMEAA